MDTCQPLDNSWNTVILKFSIRSPLQPNTGVGFLYTIINFWHGYCFIGIICYYFNVNRESIMQKQQTPIIVESSHSLGTLPPVEIKSEVHATYAQGKNGLHILDWQQERPESKSPEHVTLKIKNKQASVVRLGDVYSIVKFELDNRTYGNMYCYGGKKLEYQIFTKALQAVFSPEGGVCVHILYEMWMAETHLGFYSFDLLGV